MIENERKAELRDRVSEMNVFTDSLLARVREVIGNRRIIGYTFIYDGMDYCKVVMQEMRQLKGILGQYGFDLTDSRFMIDSYSGAGVSFPSSMS